MINYELAKKLKDAGFPQNVKKGELLTPVGTLNESYQVHYPESVYAPTLSELIKELGYKFTCLDRYEDKGIEMFQAEFMHVVFGHGNTPEAAVADLWLSLNMK